MAEQNLFYDNWKTRAYFNIIEKALERGHGDTSHHVMPLSLGGPNKKHNLVRLTHREHYVVHFLLTKMCKNKHHTYKMASAFWRMNNSHLKDKQKITSNVYEIARKTFSESQKGRQNYNLGGYTWTEEMKQNARGKRPHVNQTGINNNAFKGFYVTPWGTFPSSTLAAENAPFEIKWNRVLRLCKGHIKKINSVEDGYYFVNKGEVNG